LPINYFNYYFQLKTDNSFKIKFVIIINAIINYNFNYFPITKKTLFQTIINSF
jgi:hypothetical protein